MSKKLFVGGLSWGIDDNALQSAFGKFGEISEAKVITDRETGRSRGFGFVSYNDGANADEAQRQMDGSDLDGRTIRVNEAQARSGGGGGGNRNDDRGRGDRW